MYLEVISSLEMMKFGIFPNWQYKWPFSATVGEPSGTLLAAVTHYHGTTKPFLVVLTHWLEG